jgi:hypothetical protein
VVKVCECCGHPVPPDDIDAELTPTQRRVYHAVKRAGTMGITNPELMEKVYVDDPDGGPENTNIIAVMMKRVRLVLASRGLTIRSTGGPGSRYYLELIK